MRSKGTPGGMSIFGRYVFGQAFAAMTLILLSLCGVVWIALALRQLKLVTSKGQDTLTLLTMTTLAVPNLMALVAPVALLIATIHVLNRLNNDSELIVLSASGATVWKVARPLLLLALAVSIGLSAVNHFVMPWSLRILREKIIEVRSDLLAQVLLPGRFSSPEDGVVVHIRERRLDGTLEGILMRDERKPKEIVTYLAERGQLVKQDDGSTFLAMENGRILRAKGLNEPPEVLTFSGYAIDLRRFEKELSNSVWRPKERYFHELVWPDPKEPRYERNIGPYRAELHERLSSPLYPFAFVLIVVAFLGQAQSTRQNRLHATVLGFGVAAAFRVGGLAVNNVVVLHAWAVPLMYVLPLAGCALALVLLRSGSRQPRGRGLTDRAGDAMRDGLGALNRSQQDGSPSVARPS